MIRIGKTKNRGTFLVQEEQCKIICLQNRCIDMMYVLIRIGKKGNRGTFLVQEQCGSTIPNTFLMTDGAACFFLILGYLQWAFEPVYIFKSSSNSNCIFCLHLFF